jgi:dTDP-4-dehydrorhamnose 3,5-epimerase
MHWQREEYAQIKVISCPIGSIVDVIIDLRPSSTTYGSINSFFLSSQDSNYLRIPPGFAHGFQSLEENTILSYYVDKPYAPKSERCINPLSAAITDFWENLPRVLHEKDMTAIQYEDYFGGNDGVHK